MCARQIAKEDLPSKGLVFLIAPTISMDPQWIQPLSLIGHFCFSNTVLLAFSIGEMKPSLEQKWKNFYYLLCSMFNLCSLLIYTEEQLGKIPKDQESIWTLGNKKRAIPFWYYFVIFLHLSQVFS